MFITIGLAYRHTEHEKVGRCCSGLRVFDARIFFLEWVCAGTMSAAAPNFAQQHFNRYIWLVFSKNRLYISSHFCARDIGSAFYQHCCFKPVRQSDFIVCVGWHKDVQDRHHTSLSRAKASEHCSSASSTSASSLKLAISN